MEKIIKEFNIYNFNELDENAQNKALEIISNDEIDFYSMWLLHDDIMDELENIMDIEFNIKIDENLKTYYSLDYSQGSGAMFENKFYIEDINKKYKFLTDDELKLITSRCYITKIKIKHNDGHYYHKYSFNIDYCLDVYDDYDDIKDDYNISENDFYNLENKIDDFFKKNNIFYNDIVSINDRLTKFGYDCLEYFWNKDNIINLINDNNYKFYIDGSVFNG